MRTATRASAAGSSSCCPRIRRHRRRPASRCARPCRRGPAGPDRSVGNQLDHGRRPRADPGHRRGQRRAPAGPVGEAPAMPTERNASCMAFGCPASFRSHLRRAGENAPPGQGADAYMRAGRSAEKPGQPRWKRRRSLRLWWALALLRAGPARWWQGRRADGLTRRDVAQTIIWKNAHLLALTVGDVDRTFGQSPDKSQCKLDALTNTCSLKIAFLARSSCAPPSPSCAARWNQWNMSR